MEQGELGSSPDIVLLDDEESDRSDDDHDQRTPPHSPHR